MFIVYDVKIKLQVNYLKLFHVISLQTEEFLAKERCNIIYTDEELKKCHSFVIPNEYYNV